MTQNSEPRLFSEIITRLNPTKAFYIHHEKHHETNIIDITAQLPILYTLEIGITETSINTAKAIGTAKPPLPSTYTVWEENFFSTHHSLKNVKGEVVADSRKKVLSLGKATFSFPGQSQAIEVKPIGVKNHIQEFAIDGVKYMYRVEKGENESRLYDSVLFKVDENPWRFMYLTKFTVR